MNKRLRRCIQIIAARRSAGVVSSVASAVPALLPSPRLARVTRAQCALLGGEPAEKSGEVDAPPGHQCGQAGEEIKRVEHHVRGAVAPRRLQLAYDLTPFIEFEKPNEMLSNPIIYIRHEDAEVSRLTD